MSLDSKAIETLAVNAVKESIVTCELLDQFIVENDKEPSWDGNVNIYSDKSKSKDKLIGRVPVQVKGKMNDDHSRNKISYVMSIADLKNYLNDGGCMLFIVYIGQNGLHNKIYYNALAPIKLRKLLTNTKNQKTKTITLDEFPLEQNKKITIFTNFFYNCQKQSSFIEAKLLTLEDVKDENIVIPFYSQLIYCLKHFL